MAEDLLVLRMPMPIGYQLNRLKYLGNRAVLFLAELKTTDSSQQARVGVPRSIGRGTGRLAKD